MSSSPSSHQEEYMSSVSFNADKIPSLLLPVRDEALGGTLRWVGMNPMEWVEGLVKKTEFSESEKSSSLIKSFRTDDQWPSEVRKRYRSEGVPGMGSDTVVVIPDDADSLSSRPPKGEPKYWDLSNLPFGPQKEEMRNLILRIESHPSFSQVGLAFERTRDHFSYVYGFRTNDPEEVFNDVINKLQAILDLARKLRKEELEAMEPLPPPPPLESSESTGSVASTESKRGMVEYMKHWLRENWINPYPDEISLRDMSNECGSTPTMVSNWLINARTRKWRPAIMQAYDLGRPSEMLLEDSIRIYDNLPLRVPGDRADGASGGKSFRKRTREL